MNEYYDKIFVFVLQHRSAKWKTFLIGFLGGYHRKYICGNNLSMAEIYRETDKLVLPHFW